MRNFLLPGMALGAMLAVANPAAAQMYPGQGVTVNPNAIGGPGSLVYPGGLQPPGAGNGNLPPVHLHPPGEHRTHRRPARKPHIARKAPERPVAPAPAPQVATRAAPPPVAPPPPKPAPKTSAPVPHKTATTNPPAPAAIPFNMNMGGSSDEAPPDTTQDEAIAPPVASPPVAPPPATKAPARKTVASTGPLPKITLPKGLSKQAAILFDAKSAALSSRSTARLNELAFSLKTALANGAQQVELIAYAGPPGDKSLNARRLSLRRALAVRQQLIIDGVPAGRMDVRALGGVGPNDNGATDRVDIFVKA